LMTLASVFYMFGWEYFNRGFFTLGLSSRFGYHAAAIAMMPFFFAHFGKPPLETLGAIFGGVIMGLLAIRVKSIWPCVIIHSFMQLWMNLCAVYWFALVAGLRCLGNTRLILKLDPGRNNITVHLIRNNR